MSAPSSEAVSPDVLTRVAEAIRSVRFGAVQVTIHDSQVVQIEKLEKIRLSRTAHPASGGASYTPSRSNRTSGSPRPSTAETG